MIKSMFAAGIAACFSFAGAAHAQEWYVGGYVGLANQADSDNSGEFTSAFVTGNGGTAIPTGTTLASGTSVGWNTEFDQGLAVGVEGGIRYASNLRSGIEVSYTQADVDTHQGVLVGGGNIDGVDAAVLTGSATPLGATVGAVVADGRGEVTTLAVFANAYYDFNPTGAFQPYVGAGIGFTDVDVTYNPSGVGIVDDGETRFAYQVRAGATYRVTQSIDVYGEYTYRASDDIETRVDLFPARLDIENQQNLFSVGLRYRFG